MQPACAPAYGAVRPARIRVVCTVLLALAASVAAAQDSASTVVGAPSSSSVLAANPQGTPPCHCALAGSPVLLEITETLVSDENRPGESFGLRLAEPIVVDGVELVPAGTQGRGEIVHAAKARGGGQPGELLLAARYLDFNGHRIALRGMKLGAAGTDRAGAALGTAIAIGVFAQFIHGGEMRVPAGTRAPARLAASIDATALAQTATDSVSTAAPSTQE
jgi:hypothetical protein